MKLKKYNYNAIITLFSLIFFITSIHSQRVKKDSIIPFDFNKYPVNKTIQVSKNFETLVVFPEKIIDYFLGNDLEFILKKPKSLEGDIAEKILILKYNRIAKDFSNKTNITVITKDGYFYEFFISKVNTLRSTSCFIRKVDATKNIFFPNNESQVSYRPISIEKGEDEIVNPIYSYYSEQLKEVVDYKDRHRSKTSKWYRLNKSQMDSLYEKNKTAYYKLKSFDVSRLPKRGRYFIKNGKIIVWLKGLYYDKNEIYMSVLIENKEQLDYDIDFIKTKITTNYKKRSTKQNVPHKPLLLYNIPKRIKANSHDYFQIVFEKFSISKNRKLVLEIKEKNGERDLIMEIPHKFIKSPLKIAKR